MTYRSPREMIEGYKDELRADKEMTPVQKGGGVDYTSKISLSDLGSSSLPNAVTFFTGTDDPSKTRNFAKWNSIPSITVSTYEYTSLSESFYSSKSPWATEVPL